MRHPTVLSIDFGSAYTKLSVRRSWDESALLVRDPKAPKDNNICVPTILRRVTSRGRSEWLIGVAAHSQPPVEGIERIRYWKAALFAPFDGAEAIGTEVAAKRQKAAEFTVEFFTGLRRLFAGQHELLALPVRVCVPKLDDASSVEDLVRCIIRDSGWTAVGDRAAIFEPESNAIGLLTRGRNATWVPPRQDFRPPPQRMISMQRMFEPGLARAFRNLTGEFGVLVTDVGAFTTDFGFVRFDTAFTDDDWAKPDITQASVRLGVAKLDAAVFRLLSEDAQDCVKALPGTEWESHKRSLYAGNAIMLRRPKGGTIKIGDGAEANRIADVVREFARKVAHERAEFCARLRKARIVEEILSGGGVLIPAVRETVADTSPAKTLCDLLDPQEPSQAVRRGAGLLSSTQMDRRRVENRELLRGGSAMGGASVFFD